MKVAIYCRLSEEDKNKQDQTQDSASIQNQKSLLIHYATERQWEIYNIYSDDDYAGADRNRPQFNKLLEDAEKHKFDIVLCKTQSRFTRELEIVEKYIHGLFPLWKIRFVSIVDNADTENKGNKKSRQINGLINEWYLEDMSDNIKSVLTSKRQQGLHIGAFPLYGYTKDPNKKGALIIDPEASKIVKEVFTLYSNGYGKTAIARILNERGVPNPTAYRIAKGFPHRRIDSKLGAYWKYSAVSNILVNQMYIGNMVQGKYGSVSYKTKQNKPVPKENWIIVEGTHEPIISRQLWDDVQCKVKANFKPFLNGRIGIFSKKVKCANCGYTLRSVKNRGEHYLTCNTKHVNKNACTGAFISCKLLTETILDQLNKMLEEYVDADKANRIINIKNTQTKKIEAIQTEISIYNKKISDYTKGIKELYIDKINGVISSNDFIEFSKAFYNEREKYSKLIHELTNQLNNTKNHSQNNEHHTHIYGLNRVIIEKLIDCIIVGKRESKSKFVPIEICWNF